ncbi:syndecan-3-like isoform X1 [Myxocyprinus asiaticus]|uniref:syndecan-3-like isoform X1 n=2 Tax=Myxocyprinus asiaticus TaxID=70543 RepID=UPI0022224F48|nr:syndecan-3-like isoform X1 [Myxocyprinus asiaticus]
MKLPCWIALALLLAQTTLAQRRTSRPVDEESSGDEFYDDEDFFSGSGSGFPDMPTEAGVSVTTEEPLPLSTTQATGPAPSASPAAEPSSPPPPEVEREGDMRQEVDRERKIEMEKKEEEFEEEMKRQKERDRERERESGKERKWEADTVQQREKEQEKSKATVAPRLTEVPVVAMDSSTTLGETTVASSDLEDLSTTEEEADLFITTEMTMSEPTSTTETTTDEITTTEVLPTTVASTTAKPTRLRPAPTTPSTAPVRPRQPQTTPSRAESSSRSVMTSTVQTQTPAETVNNEVAGADPSGDFEIREDDGRQGNEVGRGKGAPGVAAEPDLTGNALDAAGSSATQLPQKNILERKEVLIAVIVGGVVGALFAAFLVMLLVYRMKKKDEGSYTLEEPKQATVTYQKPDKQEEFYA